MIGFDWDLGAYTIFPMACMAYGFDRAVMPDGFECVGIIKSTTPGVPDFGFVALNKDTKTITVSIRGTETESEWLADFDNIVVPYSLNPSAWVHRGFQNLYHTIRNSLVEIVFKYSGTYTNFIVTGHSLGAALAVFAAMDLARMPGVNVKLVTWAGPRVGLHSFINLVNQTIKYCYRITNRWDIVPHLPPSIELYENVGQEISVDGGYTNEPHRAHNLMKSYWPGFLKIKPAVIA